MFAFFLLSRAWRSRQSVACSDVIAVPRCQRRMAAPNTGGGAVAPCVSLLGALAILVCPQAVFGPGVVEGLALAHEGEALRRAPQCSHAGDRTRARHAPSDLESFDHWGEAPECHLVLACRLQTLKTLGVFGHGPDVFLAYDLLRRSDYA